ncbi:MAG: hypothetical protein WCK35_09910 [Chloroflexota bacterium]
MENINIVTILVWGLFFIFLDICFFYLRKLYFSNPWRFGTFTNVIHKTFANIFSILFAKLKLFSLNHKIDATLNPTAETVIPIITQKPNSTEAQPLNDSKFEISLSAEESTSNQGNPPTNTDHQPNLVHVQFSADIPDGTIVYITMKVEHGQGQAIYQDVQTDYKNQKTSPNIEKDKPITGYPQFNLKNWVKKSFTWLDGITLKQGLGFFIAALIIYALVISYKVNHYPIYFFTDEAIHMNLASNFLRDGLKNYFGEFLPTFFTTEGWVNGTSVYVQLLPFMLFGKSVIVTRLVSAFISLLGAAAVSLLLKDIFKLKYYWAGIFLVLTTPAWFLHARTAFEYVEVGSFYSIFLYFYSRYRAGYLRSFYWAIVAGALTFYTHGLGQIIMGVTGITLLFVDFRYHIHPERRRTVLFGILLGIVLLLPFARYYLAHPGEAAAQVKRRGSYWSDNSLSIIGKLGEFFKQYSYGLNPAYWYFKNPVDLDRHTMKNYGNGLWFTFPLLAVGLFQSIKNIRLPSYRIVLLSLFICPIPASVVAIGMPRMLWMTIPIALLSTLGLSTILQWAENAKPSWSRWITNILFVVLAGSAGLMLRDAIVNGPTWFEDYSLYGMQYGAEQVFNDVIDKGLSENPNRNYIVSPSWANGTEQFVDFFIPESLQSHVKMGQPIDFVADIRKGMPNTYFISTSDEYDKLIENPEFNNISVKEILPFPNNQPGFYVLTLNVSDNIDKILEAEHKKNITPVEDIVSIKENSIRIIHSPLGSGRVEDIFDNDSDTLARVLEANPFTFDLYPDNPIKANSITIQTGSLAKFTVTISLYANTSSIPVIYSQTYTDLPPDPTITIPFDNGPTEFSRIYIEIKDDTSGNISQIHVRTIEFK